MFQIFIHPLFCLLVFLFTGLAQGANVRLLGDLNPGQTGSFPSNMVDYAGSVFFNAYTVETGRELWRWNGTNAILATNINPTADYLVEQDVLEGNDSVPAWFTPFNGALYFSAFDPFFGGELWKWENNRATRLTDIASSTNSAFPSELTPYKGALYFYANSSNPTEDYELWKYSNGTASLVANIKPNTGTNFGSEPKGLTVFNDLLFFMANDGTNGYELWRHDGSSTLLLTNINPGGPDSSSHPKHFTQFRDHLYFQASTTDLGYELWRTDGTNVTLVADLNPGSSNSFPELFTVYNDALYFRATDAVKGSELWRFDGTNASVVADLNPYDSFPKNLTVFSNLLLFAADDGVNGWELWKYDGVDAALITNLNEFGDSFPEQFQIAGNRLYFVAATPETGYEVWSFDGEKVMLSADISPGWNNSYPLNMRAIGGKLFFSATEDGFSNWEPWILEETAISTNQNPTIGLVFPTNNLVLIQPASLNLQAQPYDLDGQVTKVEFFDGTNLLAVIDEEPFTTTISNLNPGTYRIYAVATDDKGASSASAEVQVIVAFRPQVTGIRTEESNISLTVQAFPGLNHVLEMTEKFDHWVPIITNQTSTGEMILTDEKTADFKFYRIRIQTAP